jgi:hypothetical protein
MTAPAAAAKVLAQRVQAPAQRVEAPARQATPLAPALSALEQVAASRAAASQEPTEE